MKSKETYEKVAETFEKKAAREWAKAKNGEGGHHYQSSRDSYSTAQKAREAAQNTK